MSPVVLSAGSASVSLYEPLNTKVRNQIHLVEFDTVRSDAASLSQGGTVRSWTWASGGWMPSASRSDGLPGVSGFGYRADPVDLAKQIVDEHASTGRKTLYRDDLLAIDPKLDYLAPLDLETLSGVLKHAHGVETRFYEDGTISETTVP